MKTRIILLLAISAIATLSFTFASIGISKKANVEHQVKAPSEEPVGGFVAEDKI